MQTQLPSSRPACSVPITARLACLIILSVCILLCSIALAQSTGAVAAGQQPIQQTAPAPSQAPDAQAQPAAPPQGPQSPAASEESQKDAPEISTQEPAATFQVRVNLVQVRVVVRDAQGHAVSDLKKEDFQLLDDGKPQTISRFSVEQAEAAPVIHQDTSIGNVGKNPGQPPPSAAPEGYTAYLFDDLHLDFGSLARARTAAEHNLETRPPTERVAIYTTSGQSETDFTDDGAALRNGLNRLMPRPIAGSQGANTDCPQMSYYMADMIENHGDTQALSIAAQDALDCALGQGNPESGAWTGPAAQQMARNAARQKLHLGNYETQITFATLRQVVGRIAAVPGRRTIILVSPGFLNPEQRYEEMQIEEQALHSGIVINSLDARGLDTMFADATKGTRPRHKESMMQNIDAQYQQYADRERSAQAGVLREFADATGGKFFHNSNDLGEGFRQLAAAPEYSYLLGFSPQDLKLDGRFHNLKVILKGRKLDIQARQGYFAPRKAINAQEEVRRDLEEAVFSQERFRDIPIQLHTEFFKSSEQNATLSVLVRFDARPLRYRKVEGRNQDDVTVISALFDRNGRFISGTERLLRMRLKDETLGSKLMAGLTLKTTFNVKPGSYLVRLVVCDENGRMAAQSDAVDIP